jgi:hypothetical protein
MPPAPPHLTSSHLPPHLTSHPAPTSYLGYGLMAGRAKVIESLDVGSDAHPCFASGSDAGTYAYAGKTYPVRAGKAAEYDKCAKVGAKALDLQAKCGQDQARAGGGGQ